MAPSWKISNDALFVSDRLTQASIVKFWSWRFAGFPKLTPSLSPSKLNACPTNPGANVALPSSTPLLLPTASVPFPSPFHQPTKPEGGLTHAETGVTLTSSSNKSTAIVALDVSINVRVEVSLAAVNWNVCGGP